MTSESALFPYGASYSPLVFPEEQWDADLSAMQAAGMSLIRMGDVHGSWDQIEPRQGELRLADMERFYQAAARRGQRILLSTGLSSPPLWLATQHPDLPILSSRGETYPLAASYHWACIHHPALQRAGKAYITALASLAARQPNHFGWQISNELGFPFLPAREPNDISLYCYCPHCRLKFQEWVQKKYGTLAALTQAWAWGTTYFSYNTWSEVQPPEVPPSAWSGVTRWLDWRLFWMQSFSEFAAWQHRLLKQLDPAHPTSVNTFNFKGYDRFGVYMGLDVWQLAGQVDHIGYDLYPGSGRKVVTRPEHISIFLDHGRSVSRSVGSDFWLHELESGPIGGWLLGPEYNTRPQDILRNGMEALGHDAKLALYMPWREWDYQPLHWGALVDLDGQPTPRLEAAAQLGHFIQAERDFLSQAHVPPGEVGLLESKPNAIFLRGVGQEELLFDAQRGAYRAAWEAGFNVDFLTPALAERGAASQNACLMLPLTGLLSTSTAGALLEYTRQGGVLLGFARCAGMDERGWFHHCLPIPPLAEAFGIRRLEPDDQQPALNFNGQAYPGFLGRDALLELDDDTEVLARFSDGLPAVTCRACGRGWGVYIATRADAGALKPDGGLLGAVLAELARRLSWQPAAWLNPLPAGRKLDPHVLQTPQRSLILIANAHPQPYEAELLVRLDGRIPRQVQSGFLEKRPLPFSSDPTCLHIPLHFEKEVPQVVDILWQVQ